MLDPDTLNGRNVGGQLQPSVQYIAARATSRLLKTSPKCWGSGVVTLTAAAMAFAEQMTNTGVTRLSGRLAIQSQPMSHPLVNTLLVLADTSLSWQSRQTNRTARITAQ